MHDKGGPICKFFPPAETIGHFSFVTVPWIGKMLASHALGLSSRCLSPIDDVE
jgi:hypothetical protein